MSESQTMDLTVVMVPLEAIVPSANNPRVFREKDPGLQDLAASIGAVGVLNPILVRPYPGQECNGYELLAGERRWRASRMAGKATIPAIVREVDDRAALEITVTENLQREDLHPLEEATGIAALLKAGWTADQVANQLGKSRKFVARRAALANLREQWRQWFLAEEELNREDAKDTKGSEQPEGWTLNLSAWSASHMERIAALPAEMQDYLAAQVVEMSGWDLRRLPHWTLAELDASMAEDLHLTARAPWSLEQEGLGARTCAECIERSSVQPDLFDAAEMVTPGVCRVCGCTEGDGCAEGCYWVDDVETLCSACIDENGKEKKARKAKAGKAGNDDRCLNAVCWAGKQKAWLGVQETRARAKHGDGLIKMTTDHRCEEPGVVKHYDVSEVKKSEPGAKPALVIDGPKAGQVVYVRSYTRSAPGSSTGEGAGPTSAAEVLKAKRAQLEKLRGRIVCKLLEERLAGFEGEVEAQVVYRLVLAFGIRRDFDLYNNKEWTHFTNSAPANLEGLTRNLLNGVLRVWEGQLGTQDYRGNSPVQDARRMCEVLGIDYEALWQQACAQKKEPKAWAALEAKAKEEKKAAAKDKKTAKGARKGGKG